MMNIKPGRGVGGRQPDLSELEAYLQATLQPVSPRPGFVHALRGRLFSQQGDAGQGAAGRQAGVLQVAVFAIAGLATTVLVVVTGIKATAAILGALGLLHHVQQSREPAAQPVPLQPAA